MTSTEQILKDGKLSGDKANQAKRGIQTHADGEENFGLDSIKENTVLSISFRLKWLKRFLVV